MPTKLDRIKNMEDELAELKKQVEEEVVEPEITVGCVVHSPISDFDRLLVKHQHTYLAVALTDGTVISSDDNIHNLINKNSYTFVASSLEDYYKKECCGKCKKDNKED